VCSNLHFVYNSGLFFLSRDKDNFGIDKITSIVIIFYGWTTVLTLSNPIFLPPAYPQLLFILGGKEVGGLLVIILQF
jgi:hypothetical protein